MESTFLYTAIDKTGKEISGRVAAETLSQGRYKLEVQGFSAIQFFETEINNEIRQLFGESTAKMLATAPSNENLNAVFDTRLFTTVLKISVLPLLIGIPLQAVLWWFWGTKSFVCAVIVVATIVYIAAPVAVFDWLHHANLKANDSAVKFWVKLSKLLNKFSLIQIPAIELDTKLGCALARQNELEKGLSVLQTHIADSRISKSIYAAARRNVQLAGRDFESAIKEFQAKPFDEYWTQEELIDYALLLCMRRKDTNGASEVLRRAKNTELGIFSEFFVETCEGIIKCEDGDLRQAEFYLSEVLRKLIPFKNNSYLDPLRSLINAYLTIVYGKSGNRIEARKLFERAKPYLLAHKEDELLKRCLDATA